MLQVLIIIKFVNYNKMKVFLGDIQKKEKFFLEFINWNKCHLA